jgi:hypothetical protein
MTEFETCGIATKIPNIAGLGAAIESLIRKNENNLSPFFSADLSFPS